MAPIIMITGAASGIGAALSRSYAADGCTVLAADIDTDGLARLAGETAASPGTVTTAQLDVRESSAVAAVVDAAIARYGRLDVLFNNAGIGVGGPSHELSPAHWDRAIDVNLRGVLHGVAAALPHMVQRGKGHIVNTASLAGLIPSPGLAPYAATKWAVVGATLSLRAEYAHRGVRFTALCPGYTDTPILDKGMPQDLPTIDLPLGVREMAAATPGGIYELDSLVGDIKAGVRRNEALVVAPRSARIAWRSFRWSPRAFLALGSKHVAAMEAKLRR